MKECILGIDMGSTNTKVIAADTQGRQIAYSSRKTRTYSSREGFYEYDMDQMRENFVECLKETVQKCQGWQISAIGVSSLGETNALFDADGKPLHRAITWFDQRAVAQAKRISAALSDREIYRITGQFVSPKFGLCKLLWMLDEYPDLLNGASHFMSVEDMVLYHLSGVYATDYSIAARSLCFDRNERVWSKDILSAFSLPAELFPDPHPGATVIGKLQPEIAAVCGLPSGIPVCTGGHDHACALVSSGAYVNNWILDSTGTAETTICATTSPIDVDAGFKNGVCCYPHFGKKMYREITSAQACGASVEWFLRLFGSPKAAADETVYTALFHEAANADMKDTPIYVPYIRGLQENAAACGMFSGIRDSHSYAQFARALSEGMCFAIRDRLDHYERTGRGHYTDILVVGGLAQSDWLMNLKANILERNIHIPDCTEAAAMGAAMLAGIGTGLMQEDNVGCSVARRFTAGEDSDYYRQKYGRYLRAAAFANQ